MKTGFWYCPLYKERISEGECLEINYERLEYFKGGYLKKVIQQTGKKKNKIDIICGNCPSMPLKQH